MLDGFYVVRHVIQLYLTQWKTSENVGHPRGIHYFLFSKM